MQKILRAQFDEYAQAAPYARTEERSVYRNGSYSRKIRTRVGTMCMEQSDQGQTGYKYLNMSLFKDGKKDGWLEMALIVSHKI